MKITEISLTLFAWESIPSTTGAFWSRAGAGSARALVRCGRSTTLRSAELGFG
jgi:hypothetical protein